MGIAVTDEERGLKEEDRDRPHRRRAAEHRQHHLGEHRLHRKQQERREKGGGGIGQQHEVWTWVGKEETAQRGPGRLPLAAVAARAAGFFDAGIGHGRSPVSAPAMKAPPALYLPSRRPSKRSRVPFGAR